MSSPRHGEMMLPKGPNLASVSGHETSDTNVSDFPASSARTGFGFMFEELPKHAENLLIENPETVKNLMALGNSMRADPAKPDIHTGIPAIYTYFGQFITHDISFEEVKQNIPLNESLVPLPYDRIIDYIKNTRTGMLDLDSVYGQVSGQTNSPVPRVGNELLVERAIKSLDGTDLPRETSEPYAARIGDTRNDENLIVSQLHLAFLRAHNALVKKGSSFDEARVSLRQHYQWIIIKDFLTQIANPDIVQQVLDGRINRYPRGDSFFMPLEFSAAAFRFGHSMVGNVYRYNNSFKAAQLYQLVMPDALGKYFHILESWIIDWAEFLPKGANLARPIVTSLVEPLAQLTQLIDQKKLNFSLAVRDLLRGYLLRLPTGQAVAKKLGYLAMTRDQILTVVEGTDRAVEQQRILEDPATRFLERTPLWFYILAEAAYFGDGKRLGPVGSTIVASVLIGLVRLSKDSFLNNPEWAPMSEQFGLPEFFRLAGVLAV